MAAFANTEHLDMVLTYVLVQKLLTRINNTKAYELGLVDSQGLSIKPPETDEDEEALGMLDKFVFKLKRMLGPKMNQLSNFLYVNSLDNDITKYLTVKGGVQNRASIKRVKLDVDKLAEKYDMSTDQLVMCLIEGMSRDAQ